MKDFLKNKALRILILILSWSTPIWAQDAAAVPPQVAEFNNVVLWLFMGFVAVVVLTVAFVAYRVLNLYQTLLTQALDRERGYSLTPPSVPTPAKENIFSKIWYQLTGTGAVAIEKEADIMLAHAHDGIFELDNRLPPWWLNMFYITVVFAFGYIWYYHFYEEGERGQLYEYKMAMKEGEVQKALRADAEANSVNENSVVAATDKPILDLGGTIFIEKCAACHGQKGEGGVGPNMTDDYWIHGGSVKNIFATIKNGVPEKGMIAWKDQLRPADIQAVASYILSLKGTNPPNGKAPQGEKYVETEGIKAQ
jgi:cytochrome c oxidase cbb3-type subunit III